MSASPTAVANATTSAGAVSRKRIVFASFIGTAIEFYDFYVYATAAALVIGPVFFPHGSATAQALSAFVTFGIAFIARPIGSFLFGHFGDRIGRKSTLVASLLVMGLSTTAIGLVPGYDAIGTLAPVLLCVLRFGQGIGLGGEWGGASLMVLEHAPARRRGLFGSLVQIGFPLGLVLSYGVFALATTMPEASFKAYGWRIPFLISIVLLGVGWFVRARVPETPLFSDLKKRGAVVRNPFVEAVFRNPRSFLVAVGLKISEVSWVYILTIFAVVYATTKLQLPRQTLLTAIAVAALVEVVSIPLFGWLSDIWGRRPLYFLGTAFTVCFAFPLFWLLDTKDPQVIVLAIVVALSFGHGTMFGLQSAYFPELFGTRVRYSGASFGFQLAAAIGGGLAPVIATALTDVVGGTSGVSLMLIALAVVTFIATLFARETRDAPLHD